MDFDPTMAPLVSWRGPICGPQFQGDLRTTRWRTNAKSRRVGPRARSLSTTGRFGMGTRQTRQTRLGARYKERLSRVKPKLGSTGLRARERKLSLALVRLRSIYWPSNSDMHRSRRSAILMAHLDAARRPGDVERSASSSQGSMKRKTSDSQTNRMTEEQ